MIGQQNDKHDPITDALSGGLAGVVSRLVIAPLDLLKIRLQLQHENIIRPSTSISSPKYTGIAQATRLIVAEEGIRALWKGSLAGIYLYGPYMAVQFVVYNQAKWWTTQSQLPIFRNETFQNFSCGGFAAVGATFASYPFDLLRTRLAAQGKNNEYYSGITSAITQIGKSEGLKGFYRGFGVTLLGIVPNMGLQFAIYEFLDKEAMRNMQGMLDSPSFPLIAGATKFGIGFTSGTLAKIMTMPFDVMKRRLQMAGLKRDPGFGRWHDYSGSIKDCMVTIWKGEGWRGFFKATIPSILKAAPTSAVTFVSYEVCFWAMTNFRT